MKKIINFLTSVIGYSIGVFLGLILILLPFAISGLGIAFVLFIGIHVLRAMGVGI